MVLANALHKATVANKVQFIAAIALLLGIKKAVILFGRHQNEVIHLAGKDQIVQAQTGAAAGDIIQLIKIMSVGQKMVGRLAALHFYKADRQNCLPAHFSSPLPSKYISRFN